MVPKGASLVLAAGGSSRRMGNGSKKEFAELDGEVVLCKTLRPFIATKLFSTIIIVLPEQHIERAEALVRSAFPAPGSSIICTAGGAVRQESVFKGLLQLKAHTGIVLIHDGARPWVTEEVIFRVYRAALQRGAAVPVIPSVNALKEIDGEGRIVRSLERSAIVGAQTPQGFDLRSILTAHRKAADDGRVYPDDAEVFSTYGGDVFTVPGDTRNKKITFMADLES